MGLTLDRSHLIEVAADIAAEIAATAVWLEDRCNWVGALPEELADGRVTLAYRALGADLYNGTAGVGLFLAELSRVTGEGTWRRVALGALRHARSHANDPITGSAGLYTGRPGIALALALAASALEAPELTAAARGLLKTHPPWPSGGESDLMSGSAGAIVALLALHRLLEDDTLLDVAAAHGEALLGRAQQTESGLCWLSPNFPDTPGLTGFSHGAAGAATALLELGAVTGDDRVRAAAEAAFAYERALWNPIAANWPDLRKHGPAGSTQPSFACFWCHGAPGGVLARLRARELGAEAAVEAEARAALRTTKTWVQEGLASGLNFSLCHGLAGNAEILVEAAGLDDEARQLAYLVAATGMKTYGRDRIPWPSGAHGGTTAGLFLGLAGIGRFYLRLAQPELSSLLLVRPQPRSLVIIPGSSSSA